MKREPFPFQERDCVVLNKDFELDAQGFIKNKDSKYIESFEYSLVFQAGTTFMVWRSEYQDSNDMSVGVEFNGFKYLLPSKFFELYSPAAWPMKSSK